MVLVEEITPGLGGESEDSAVGMEVEPMVLPRARSANSETRWGGFMMAVNAGR